MFQGFEKHIEKKVNVLLAQNLMLKLLLHSNVKILYYCIITHDNCIDFW